jgi:putative ABC transport system ATP-binding protein
LPPDAIATATAGAPALAGKAATTAACTCVGVVKIYWTPSGEVHALKGIDAVFPAGTVSAVVGPSGSGKSSLLRILAGLDAPTAGQVTVGSVALSGLGSAQLRKVRRRLLGYVFQRPADNLIPYLNVTEHLALAARLRGSGAGHGDHRELLATLGLEHRARHLPRQLSGGEQQRLAFARAVAGDPPPPLVVADEPTAELDSASGEALLTTVQALARRGTGFVLATHDPAVERLADKTLYLRHGAMEAEAVERQALSVIDAAGRVQLPPDLLQLFPDRRARISLDPDGGRVWIVPP